MSIQTRKEKQNLRETPQPRQYFTQNLFTQKNQRKFFLSVNPFKYLDQYYYVRMALIIEGIFINKTVVSLQIKVHECYVKQLKPRQSLLKINESDNESDDESDTETVEQSEVDNIEDLIISDKEVEE